MARLKTTRPPLSASGEYVAEVRGHSRSFGKTQVLRSIDLAVRPGEFVALLGRSGCGKSTLLRSLARLDQAPADEVAINGRTSVAFQEPRLLPWRRVHENVALALLNTPERRERDQLAEQTLAEVGLSEKLGSWPRELSGGQAQRVSLARALVSNPSLLLLDEPFSALDALTRIEMHQLVIELWRRHSMAVLLVTHDVDEALALADRLVVMDEGRLAQSWQITQPRSDRPPSHPEIAGARAEILRALGVKPTPPNPNRNPLNNALNNRNQGAA
ncbi:sulfonate transport system ATP-binding protein [Nocardioides ginsengisegetis]|uniref:Sulfonate transport system ATP-binding protein n=1 Tax=Nocardioides ginsengisegetis TaxID=661491 RepID=A0A7W3IYV3_9ACTN|nr:ABC transporter ATP-binding protein [Nocardioides ginsengisegetis]MBA8803131.1 sulfonate transport system ATP-binding protein [Nocardioides ginsengisegetis]